MNGMTAGTILGFCMQCANAKRPPHQQMANIQYMKTSNNKTRAKGRCPRCGGNMSKLVKSQ
jgi:ssDNA-binding Zn-finger/Zn-ribbon topoisomerase 1